MKVLVTGSSGHLGEALVRTLRAAEHEVVGLDVVASPWTDRVGSITEPDLVAGAVSGCDVVLHTATLHKPHIGTHTRADFVDVNVSGTLNLLEAAAADRCRSFIYTSTTSAFGDAMKPAQGEPAVWVTEALTPRPKNIYGVTKSSAEDLCAIFQRNTDLSCVVLKTSRFFQEQDDVKGQRESFDDANLKVNELLFRRVDVADIVSAHLLAADKAADLGFAKFIISATTPFDRDDAAELGVDAPSVLARRVPEYVEEYARRGWRMFPALDRVYDNQRARELLGWQPEYDFQGAIRALAEGQDYRSELTRAVGPKRYHETVFEEGPYPVSGF